MDLLNTFDKVGQIKIPCLFISGQNDELVPVSHVETLYKECGSGLKFLSVIQQGHNGKRNKLIFDDALKFIQHVTSQRKVSNVLFLDSAIQQTSFDEEVCISGKKQNDFQKHHKKVGSKRREALKKLKAKVKEQKIEERKFVEEIKEQQKIVKEDYQKGNSQDLKIKRQTNKFLYDEKSYNSSKMIGKNNLANYYKKKSTEKKRRQKQMKSQQAIPFLIDQSDISSGTGSEESNDWEGISEFNIPKQPKRILTKQEILQKQFKHFLRIVAKKRRQKFIYDQERDKSQYSSKFIQIFILMPQDQWTIRLAEIRLGIKINSKKNPSSNQKSQKKKRRIFDESPKKAEESN